MYTLTVPYTNYKGIARKKDVSFNLDAHEVMKMLPQISSVFTWLDSQQGEEKRELSTEDVSEFYTDFEALILEAWGEMSDDGELFRKGNKYEFMESALFNAAMVYFVFNPEEMGKMVNGMMPPELIELARSADPETLEAAGNSRVKDLEAEIERLKSTSGTSGTIKNVELPDAQ